MQHLLSIHDLNNDEILALFEDADHYVKNGVTGRELDGFIVATLFYEASTRTRLSFETAAYRLGAQVIGFHDAKSSSVSKGETLTDTIRVVQSYADLIVLRHTEAGGAREAATVATVPVVNAGDGHNEHPTQTLCDLYTIHKRIGAFAGLRVAMTGDLRFGRTAHSLSLALARFGAHLVWVGPPELQMDADIAEQVVALGGTYEQVPMLRTVIADLDVIYVTRPQRERWADETQAPPTEVVSRELIALGKPEVMIMHPLPRTEELATDIDETPNAAFFEEVQLSVPMRMAILMRSLAGTTPQYR